MKTTEQFFSFIVRTEFDSKVRYDQSGIIMYLDSDNWLKAAMEYENDRIQRLGSVVTNNGYSDYAAQDLKNYTIKVHALKSSAKLIGAIQLSEDAQSMENAGKAEDIEYIHAHHASLMDSFRRYREVLAEIYEKKEKDTEAERKPIADLALMESVYEAFAEAAKAMDCDLLEETFQEMEEYAIPESESERFQAIKECADQESETE